MSVPEAVLRPRRTRLALRLCPGVCAMFATLAVPAVEPQPASFPTYAGDIARILRLHCVECHRPQGIGPFSLLSYDEVRPKAATIAEVTASRYMPPWKPASDHGPALRGERRLSDRDLALIGAWVTAGAPPGDLAEAPPPPVFTDDWRLGPPDLVIELDEPYVLAEEGPDVFRNVVIPVPLDSPRYVRAVEFKPGATLAVHHANVGIDNSGDARRRDAAEAGTGWSSMDLGEAANPRGHIIGWTPGQAPYEAYPGTAWRLDPGVDLVVQLHLLPTGRPTPVKPRLGLYFASEPPERSSTVLLLREHTIDIPPGEPNYEIVESLVLPAPARVLGLYPHAHYIGRDLRIFADLPDGSRRWLLRIPDWDFNWPGDYRYVEPLRLPAGARIVMRYSYDNSAANPRNPSNPPRRVRLGWNSSDEMGEVALQLLLDRPEDEGVFELAQARYDHEALGSTPETVYALAGAYHQLSRLAEAEQSYREVLALQPDHARALNNLAVLRIEAGDDAEAETLFRRLVVIDPDSRSAPFNLGMIHLGRGELQQAVDAFEGVLNQHPGDLPARTQLARLLAEAGMTAPTVALLRGGLRWHASDARYLVQLGQAEASAGDRDSARERFEAAARMTGASAHDRSDAWFSLAVLAQGEGDLAQINRALDEALQLRPDHAQALLMSAAVALVRNDPDLAVTRLVRLLSLPPAQRPTTESVLGLLPPDSGARAMAGALARTGRLEEATRLLIQAADAARRAGQAEEAARAEVLLRQLVSQSERQ